MDEKSTAIMGEIETYRDKLTENLSDLESRVRGAADWRTHYDRHPYLFMGAALGGGALLASVMSRGSGSNVHRDTNGFTQKSEREKGPANEIMDSVKSALVIYGTAKAKELLGRVLPGFHSSPERNTFS